MIITIEFVFEMDNNKVVPGEFAMGTNLEDRPNLVEVIATADEDGIGMKFRWGGVTCERYNPDDHKYYKSTEEYIRAMSKDDPAVRAGLERYFAKVKTAVESKIQDCWKECWSKDTRPSEDYYQTEPEDPYVEL